MAGDAKTIRHHKLIFQIFRECYEKKAKELAERPAAGRTPAAKHCVWNYSPAN